jgi:hypothetical protein
VSLTTKGCVPHHERDPIPFALSLSKGDSPAPGSWFDKLTTNGTWFTYRR